MRRDEVQSQTVWQSRPDTAFLAGNSNGDSLGQLGLGLVLHHLSDRLGRWLALALLLLLLLGGLLPVGLKGSKSIKSKQTVEKVNKQADYPPSRGRQRTSSSCR